MGGKLRVCAASGELMLNPTADTSITMTEKTITPEISKGAAQSGMFGAGDDDRPHDKDGGESEHRLHPHEVRGKGEFACGVGDRKKDRHGQGAARHRQSADGGANRQCMPQRTADNEGSVQKINCRRRQPDQPCRAQCAGLPPQRQARKGGHEIAQYPW